MPTYDYQCREGHRFELFQRISEEPVATCPECGALAERMISGGAGFLFKGDGFYITDYRSEDYRKKASAEQGGSKDGAGAKTGEGGGDGASAKGAGSGAAGAGTGSGGGTGSAKSGGSGASGGSSGSGGSTSSSDS